MNPVGNISSSATTPYNFQDVDLNASRLFENLKKTFTSYNQNNQFHSVNISVDFIHSILENFSNVLNVTYAKGHYNVICQNEQTATLDFNFLFVAAHENKQNAIIINFNNAFTNWLTTQLNLDNSEFESCINGSTCNIRLFTFPNFINFTFSFSEKSNVISSNLIPYFNEIDLKKFNEESLNNDFYNDLIGTQPRTTEPQVEEEEQKESIPDAQMLTPTIAAPSSATPPAPTPSPSPAVSSSEAPKPTLSATAEEQESLLNQIADKQKDCKQRASIAIDLFSKSCNLNQERQKKAIKEIRVLINEFKKDDPLLAFQLFVNALSKISFAKLDDLSNPKNAKIIEELLGILRKLKLNEKNKEEHLLLTLDLFTHIFALKSKIDRVLLARLLHQSIALIFNKLNGYPIALQGISIEKILDLILTSSSLLNLNDQVKLRELFVEGLLQNDLYKNGCVIVLEDLVNSLAISQKIKSEIKHIIVLIIKNTPAELVEENLESFLPFIENNKGIFDQTFASKINASNFINKKAILFNLSVDRFLIFFKSFLNKCEDEIVDRSVIENVLIEGLNKITDSPNSQNPIDLVSELFPKNRLKEYPTLEKSVLDITNPKEQSLVDELRDLFPKFAIILGLIQDPSDYQQIRNVVLKIFSQENDSEKNNIIEALYKILISEEKKLKNLKGSDANSKIINFYGLQICVFAHSDKYFDKAIELLIIRNKNSLMNESNFKVCFECIYRQAVLTNKVAKIAPLVVKEELTLGQIFHSKLAIIKIQLSEFLQGNWHGFNPEQSAKELDFLAREYKYRVKVISEELVDLVTDYIVTLDEDTKNNPFIKKYEELFSTSYKKSDRTSSSQEPLPPLETIQKNYQKDPKNLKALTQYIDYCEKEIKASTNFGKVRDRYITLADLYEELLVYYKNQIKSDPSLILCLKATELNLATTYIQFCQLLYKENSEALFQFAINAYSSLKLKHPESAQLMVTFRPYLYETGNHDILRDIVSKTPHISYTLSRAHFSLGNLREHIAHFEKAIKQPNTFVHHSDYFAAVIYFTKIKNWDKALDTTKKLLENLKHELNDDLLNYYSNIQIRFQYVLSLKSESQAPVNVVDYSNPNAFNSITDLLRHYIYPSEATNEFYANNLINLFPKSDVNEIKNNPFLVFIIQTLIIEFLTRKNIELAVNLFISAIEIFPDKAVLNNTTQDGSDLHTRIALEIYNDSGEKHFDLLLKLLPPLLKHNFYSKPVIEIIIQTVSSSKGASESNIVGRLFSSLNAFLEELIHEYIKSPHKSLVGLSNLLSIYYPIILFTIFTQIPESEHTYNLLQRLNDCECENSSEEDRLSIELVKSMGKRFDLEFLKNANRILVNINQIQDINPILFINYCHILNTLPKTLFTDTILSFVTCKLLYNIFDHLAESDDIEQVELFIKTCFEPMEMLVNHPRITPLKSKPNDTKSVNKTIAIIESLKTKYQESKGIVEGLSTFIAHLQKETTPQKITKKVDNLGELEMFKLDYLVKGGALYNKLDSVILIIGELSIKLLYNGYELAFGNFRTDYTSSIFNAHMSIKHTPRELMILNAKLTHTVENILFVYQELKSYLDNKKSGLKHELIPVPDLDNVIKKELDKIVDSLDAIGSLFVVIFNNLDKIHNGNLELNVSNSEFDMNDLHQFLEKEISQFEEWNQKIPNAFNLPLSACLMMLDQSEDALECLGNSNQESVGIRQLYLQTLYNLSKHEQFIHECEKTSFSPSVATEYYYSALANASYNLKDWGKTVHYLNALLTKSTNIALSVTAFSMLLCAEIRHVDLQKLLPSD